MMSPRQNSKRYSAGAALLLAALLMLPATAARAYDDPAFEADSAADPGDAGRVRFLEGGVFMDRIAEDRSEEGATNAPVFAGDLVRTDYDGRVEIQLADGSLVRVDRNTSVEFRSLVDAYETSDSPTILRLSGGSLYLDVRGRRGSRGRDTLLQVDTPLASIYVDSAGLFRVDSSSNATILEVASHRGSAEVVGDDGSEFLRSGERTVIEDGYPPTRPARFNSYVTDEFDRWNEKRMTYYVRTSGGRDTYDDPDYDRIPSEVRPYAGELSSHGRWVHVPDYGLCWYPIGVGTAWRPYHYGHWSHGPHGWFWVSYDPWGWAPYRYGRWHHTGIHGWVWVPGRVYSGAHVSWYYGPSYIGWAPLDYYNRPAYIRIGFSLGGYGCDPYVWNFVPYNKVVVKHVHKHKIKTVHVAMPELRKGVITRTAVPRRPDAIARDPGARREAINWARDRAGRERATPTARVAERSPRGFSGGTRPDTSLRSFRDGERDSLARIARRTATRTGGERNATGDRRFARERTAGPAGKNPRVVTREGLPREGVSLRQPGSADDRRSARPANPRARTGRTPSATTRTPAKRPDGETARQPDRRRAAPRTFSRDRTGERARRDPKAAPRTGNVRTRPPADRPRSVRPTTPRTNPRQGAREAAPRTRERSADTPNRPVPRERARTNNRGSSDDRLRQLFRGADRRRGGPSPGERARSGSSDRSRERATSRSSPQRPQPSARGGSSRGGSQPSARGGSSKGGSKPSARRAPSKKSGGGKKAAPRGKSSRKGSSKSKKK